MSREIHFIVVVNIDDKTVRIDDDTFITRFSSKEQVWDTELSEWRDFDEEATEYTEAVQILNNSKLERE